MGYHMNDFAGRVARYRQELAALADARDAAVADLEQFRDSAAYTSKVAEIDAEWKAVLDALRAEHRPMLVAPLTAMRKEVEKRMGALKLPTAEQIVLLQVLQMRTSVPKSELDRAAKMLEGCPTGLAVLDDIAEKSGHRRGYSDGPDPDRVLQQIDRMENAVGWMLSAERHDLKHLPGQTPDDIRRTTLIQEHASAEDCVRRFGSIPTDELEGFESMVEIQA